MPWEGFSLFIDLNYWFGPFFRWSRDNWWGSCWSEDPEKEVLSFFGNLLLCLLELPSRICRQMSKLSIIVRLALQMSNWLFKCQTGSSVYCHDFFRKFCVFSQFVDSAPWYQVLRVELGSWVESFFHEWFKPLLLVEWLSCLRTFVALGWWRYEVEFFSVFWR